MLGYISKANFASRNSPGSSGRQPAKRQLLPATRSLSRPVASLFHSTDAHFPNREAAFSPFRHLLEPCSPVFTFATACDTVSKFPASYFLKSYKELLTMEWTTPQHEEIDLNCEISSYANAEL
jgi:hypothetical protein